MPEKPLGPMHDARRSVVQPAEPAEPGEAGPPHAPGTLLVVRFGHGAALELLRAYLDLPCGGNVDMGTAWSFEHGGETVALVTIGALSVAMRRLDLRIFIEALDGLLAGGSLPEACADLGGLIGALHRLDALLDEAVH